MSFAGRRSTTLGPYIHRYTDETAPRHSILLRSASPRSRESLNSQIPRRHNTRKSTLRSKKNYPLHCNGSELNKYIALTDSTRLRW
jgi:hypothetical protein